MSTTHVNNTFTLQVCSNVCPFVQNNDIKGKLSKYIRAQKTGPVYISSSQITPQPEEMTKRKVSVLIVASKEKLETLKIESDHPRKSASRSARLHEEKENIGPEPTAAQQNNTIKKSSESEATVNLKEEIVEVTFHKGRCILFTS